MAKVVIPLTGYDMVVTPVAAGATQVLTGPAGATGQTGATGATGASGATGSTGAKGDAGAAGAAGATGASGPPGADGVAGKDGKDGKDGALSIQRTRLQTNTAGVLQWTFPTPFATGLKPVIGVAVEDATVTANWGHEITSLTNTSVTIQLSKTTPVTVLGLSVLGVSSTPQAFVHLTAIAP